jgi:hypothetical protein
MLSHATRIVAAPAASAITANPSATSANFKVPPNSTGRVIVGVNITTNAAISTSRDRIELYGHNKDDGSDAGYPLNDDLSTNAAYNLLANSGGQTSCRRAVSVLWFPVIEVRYFGDGTVTITHAEDMVILSQVPR